MEPFVEGFDNNGTNQENELEHEGSMGNNFLDDDDEEDECRVCRGPAEDGYVAIRFDVALIRCFEFSDWL